jgi:molybdenum cofactor synthesis domain-containing protein
MISVAEAQNIIAERVGRLGTEHVELLDAVGRVLAEPVIADSDMPPFDRSQMDGYAVIAADTLEAPATLKIVGESAAGRGWHHQLKPGEAVRIMTGAAIPEGADAVQKLEVASESGDRVEIIEPTETGRYIVEKGSEIKAGTIVFKPGARIRENMIASLAAFGYAKVRVAEQPRVAIIGTGSEIVEIDETPGRDKIRNSNSVMLAVLARKCGAYPGILANVGDEISDLKSRISNAAAAADVVVLTGGVSVGKYDHTKAALAELGAEIFFEKIRLKPGKPAVFARLGETLIFGLPGNPVSAAVTFHLFVGNALLNLQGAAESDAKRGHAVLGGTAKAARERDTYLPARLDTDSSGRLVAHPLKWFGSSDFVGFARADALVVLPQGTSFTEGSIVDFIHL